MGVVTPLKYYALAKPALLWSHGRLLRLPPTAAPAAVKGAYEDAVEDEVAQQTLLTPRLRIEAEVDGFLDVDPRLAADIVADIRSGVSIGELGEKLGNAPLYPAHQCVQQEV
jgi:hypothetical protein